MHKSDAVASGETFILPTNNENVFAYLRRKDNEVVIVILNLSKQDRIKVFLENEWLKGNYVNVFSGLSFSFSRSELFELMGGDYLVYKSA